MNDDIAHLTVVADRADPRRGSARLHDGGRAFACALGRGGVSGNKREGDGATPLGRFALRDVLYRPDREAAPRTRLPTRALDHQDGWCDEPGATAYNRMVRLPYPSRYERLWRDDQVYDLIVVVGYNDAPVVSGRGSAIFIHLARDNYAPTEGCIAFARDDLLEILAALAPASMVTVKA